MRLAILLLLTCAGCDVVFQLDHVIARVDGSVGAEPGGSDVPNFAFVTSQKIAPGTLGGVAAADALCGSLAGQAGHPGNYVAWLSSSTSSAPSRIGASARGWVRIDGRPFADTLVDIVQGHVWYPLRITEAGDDVASSGLPADLTVATGTDPNGSPSIYTCDDYTNPSPGVTSGLADDAPYGWDTNMGGVCSDPARLYCFGIDHVAPVSIVPESTRHAFVTQNDLASGAGIASLDQACGTEAIAKGLTGTYRAALATTAQSALSRFTPGMAWVRFDGATVIDASGTWLAPLEEDVFGTIEGPTVAWSGAPSLSAIAPTSAASCGDWTRNDTELGLTGNDTRSGPEGFGGIPNPCNNAMRLYCLED